MNRVNYNLCCFTVNCVIVKMFIDFSGFLVYDNNSSAWIALLLSIALCIVLVLLGWAMRGMIARLLKTESIKNTVYVILSAYFICASLYYIYALIGVLSSFPYENASRLAALAVIAAAVLVISLGGKRSIYKLHGICVPLIILGILAVIINAARHCDIFNAAPLLGNGAGTIAASGFKNLFAFSEILLPAVYITVYREKQEPRHTFTSILIGLLIYAAFYITMFLAIPSEYAKLSGGSLSRGISRFSGLSRLNVRFDVVSIVIASASGILYLSAALAAAGKLLRSVGIKGGAFKKSAAAVVLLSLSALFLSGCGDLREVENTAYVIAAGVDASPDGGKPLFTLQISNPLKNGSNLDAAAVEGEEEEEGGEKSGEKPVSNITISAENIFEALENSKSYLGKTPTLTHMKLIVFSEDVLRSGNVYELCRVFLSDDEVRPETKLCTASSAKDYLSEVEPSLEESAARYYELLFSDKSAAGSLETDLMRFTTKITSQRGGGYMPYVTKDGLNGALLFSGSAPTMSLNAEECRLINLALGNCGEYIYFTNSDGEVYGVSNKKDPKITTEIENNKIFAEVSLDFKKIKSPTGSVNDKTKNELKSNITSLISSIYSNNCDVLQIKKYVSTQFMTQTDYSEFLAKSTGEPIDIKVFFRNL